ncbi:hypothetical protein GIB67_039901 [Kingdonia uniflora]|uniref:FH2 domain-containing protein n=1 Tax=Kingdonia uniflora TaxID=39325 RepID=A0A7J7P3N4_9MAGN|nr:hypothetical protein GIB67_039901 [Kingdonia uniflora]
MRAKILWVWNLRSDDDKVIRSAMDVRRVSCCVIVFVILLSALTAGSSGARKNDNGSSSLTLTINEDTVEKLWLYCRLDLMHIKDSLDSLPLLMKQILLDCIKKHNIEFHVYGESLSDTEIGYNKYLEFMFRWPDGSRRSLSSKLLEVAATPASAPGIPPLNLGPAPAPTGFQAPKPQPPSEAPRQPLLLPNVDLSTLPSSNEHSSDSPEISSSHVVSKKRHNEKVVIAVVVTATSTFLFATLLFYCYCKCRNRSGPGDGQKDEGPLLALSLSDYSTGSSRKSFALGNSSNKEKFGSSSFNNPSQNGKHPSSNSNLSVYSIESDIHKSSLAEGPLSVAFATVIRPSTEPSVAAGNVQTQPSKPPPGKLGPAPPPIPVDIKAGSRPPPPPPPPTGAPRPPPPPVGAPRPPPAPVGAPRPPPAPLGAPRPPPVFPIKSKVAQPSPLGPNHLGSGSSIEAAAKKTKLKPFFWDKVLANPDQSMVWHQISSGSFQFNEEMIETLFGHSANDKSKAGHKNELSSLDPSTQYIQIIDSKKAQNLSILLRALNVTTDEVCDALQEATLVLVLKEFAIVIEAAKGSAQGVMRAWAPAHPNYRNPFLMSYPLLPSSLDKLPFDQSHSIKNYGFRLRGESGTKQLSLSWKMQMSNVFKARQYRCRFAHNQLFEPAQFTELTALASLL